jgi:hypothetical protein
MSLIEHDKDFFLWTRQQAEALRRLAEARPNGEVDWPNLIEEIEDLGKEQQHAIVSHLIVALVHLFKLSYSPDLEPRRHWMVEIDAQRGSLERRLRINPSLRARSDELLAEAWRLASRQLKLQFGRGSAIPTDCPFTLAQLLNDDWFPETPAGDGSVG